MLNRDLRVITMQHFVVKANDTLLKRAYRFDHDGAANEINRVDGEALNVPIEHADVLQAAAAAQVRLHHEVLQPGPIAEVRGQCEA